MKAVVKTKPGYDNIEILDIEEPNVEACLLYTSDAADEL